MYSLASENMNFLKKNKRAVSAGGYKKPWLKKTKEDVDKDIRVPLV